MRKFPHLLITVTTIILGITMFSMASAKSAEENEAEGIAFLTENGKKPDVITTESGLQYTILNEGTGARLRDFDHLPRLIVPPNFGPLRSNV